MNDKNVTDFTQQNTNTIFFLQEQVEDLLKENKELWFNRKLLLLEIQQKENIILIYEREMERLMKDKESGESDGSN